MASNSPSAAIGRSEGFSAPEARAEHGKALEKQVGQVLSDATTSNIGDASANARWLEMTMTRSTSSAQAQLMLNDGFTLTDDKVTLADKSGNNTSAEQLASKDFKGDKTKEQTEAEKAKDEDLRKTADAIRKSGMLDNEDRKGPGDVEYKMVIFHNGNSTHAYKQKFVMHDKNSGSDVYMADPRLSQEIFANTVTGNGLGKLIHSHPNKPGMDPNLFSKEDIAESNAAGVDSLIVTPDGRVFKHKANPDGRYMNAANVTDEMRKPDECLGKFDAQGKFHKATTDANKNVTFEKEGF